MSPVHHISRKIAAALTFAAISQAQRIPGLGSDPLNKQPPPVVRKTSEPPDIESSRAAHERAKAELSKLIAAAGELRDQLEADGPDRLSAGTAEKVRQLQKSLKALEATLKTRR